MIVTSILYSIVVGFSFALGGNVLYNCHNNEITAVADEEENNDNKNESEIEKTTDTKGFITLNDLVKLEKKDSNDSIDNKYTLFPIQEVSSTKETSPVQETSTIEEKKIKHKKETHFVFSPFLAFRVDDKSNLDI